MISLHCLHLGSIKTRFEICEDEHGELRCHSGGMIIFFGKERKEGRQTIFLLILSTAMQMRQNLLQILRSQEKYKIKFIGDLNKMQCTGFIGPQHKMLVLHSGRQVLTPLLRTSLSKRMRRKGCQRKWEKRNVRKTAHTSRTTKSNTKTIMGSYEIRHCKHASRNR